MDKSTKTVLEIINSSLKEAGFSCELQGNIRVSFDRSPIFFKNELDYKEESYYRDETQSIEGVISDEGQACGYYFEINPATYSLSSERTLLYLLNKEAAEINK